MNNSHTSQIRFNLSRETSWLTRVRWDRQDGGKRVSKLNVKAPVLKILWILKSLLTCHSFNIGRFFFFFYIRFSFIWFHSICWFLFFKLQSSPLFYIKVYAGPCLQTFLIVLLINIVRFIIICSSVFTDLQFCIDYLFKGVILCDFKFCFVFGVLQADCASCWTTWSLKLQRLKSQNQKYSLSKLIFCHTPLKRLIQAWLHVYVMWKYLHKEWIIWCFWISNCMFC